MADKKFKCIYCDNRYTRKEMVAHIERKHMSEIPQGFTPLRAAFHIYNGKSMDYAAPCRICKKPTDWDENKGRYNQLCNDKRCKELYIEKMKKDMGDKIGSNRPTASPEGLKKMLAARKISGTYKFQDGASVAYTGSYELKALEFMDKILNVKSEDIMVPGPVLEYELDNKKHIYIPDMYYIPYNLIIEVKDGGGNTNNNPKLFDTRRKQIAKEKYVIDKTDYNYIRLTNNNFEQILNVFADLKMSFLEARWNKKNKAERVIHVNESISSAVNAPMPPASLNDTYVVQYQLQNTVFGGETHFAVSDNPKFDRIFKRDMKGNLIKDTYTSLENCDYNTFIVKGSKARVEKFINDNIGKPITEDAFYFAIFGHPMYTDDQIMSEADCVPYEDFYHNIDRIDKSLKEYIKK